MDRIMKAGLRHVTLFGLLACLCLGLLGQTRTQTGQRHIPTTPGKPGLQEGYTIIDGDIQMPISVVNAMRRQARTGAVAAPDASFDVDLWPNGIVPFEFQTDCVTFNCPDPKVSGCVLAENQRMAEAAMNELEQVSEVRFKRCPNNACSGGSYIRIRDSTNDRKVDGPEKCSDDSKNSSPVGRQKQGQILNIKDWGSRFVIVHELMHALGFFHEQSRFDHINYVELQPYCGNVMGGCMGDTYKNNFLPEGFEYGPYDFDSVMHYGPCDFSISSSCPNDPTLPKGGRTVVVKMPYDTQLSPDGKIWQDAIGQRIRLSNLDKLTLFLRYGKPNWRFVNGKPFLIPRPEYGDLTFPYLKLSTAIDAVPTGGAIWIEPETYTLSAKVNKKLTLRAPRGGVIIKQGLLGSPLPTLASVSAASYGGELATDSIVAAFGSNLTANTAAANSLPLPTQLAGVTVKVTDSEKVTRDAPLFFVSPLQINYLVPTGTKPGIAEIAVFNGGAQVAKSEAPVNPVAPALFTADASGQGAPAAVALRVRADGSQSVEPVAQYDTAQQRFVLIPIDLGPESEQLFLILFGTGFRAGSGADSVATFIGDEIVQTLYTGAAPGFAGLDQANVRVPRSLAGKGEVSVLLMVDNRSANVVTVNIR